MNDSWQDGPCRNCQCLESSPGIYQSSCSKIECQPIESSPDFPEYILEAIPVQNECCPTFKRTACKHEGTVYNAGEEWAATPDNCVISRCVKTDTGIEKRSVVKECDVSCDLGWEYAPAAPDSKECCGSCKPVGCVVDGNVRKIGEQWTSKDYCTNYVCLHVNGSVSRRSYFLIT